MERIGVRELRQHASRYLARVRAGETIEVTDRGTPVARLVPVTPGPTSHWDDLVGRGLVRLPTLPGSILDLEPVVLPEGSPTMSEVLAELRADER
jgi:prevent-host-death family protein